MISIDVQQESMVDNTFLKDFEERLNPKLMTELLAEGVPVIKDIAFQYVKVAKGYCQSLLPLNQKSSNQHGTHQAMLIGMAGDYTGGLALASLIQEEPILGIHEVKPDKGMSLWLVGAEMKYRMPSTEDLLIEATVPIENMVSYNRRYHEGKSLFVTIPVSFFTKRKEIVAEGSFRYYCKKKSFLKAPGKGEKAGVMYEHLIKSSAKLIARLRAMEKFQPNPLFTDSFAEIAAGKQGKVIADRFNEILPALQKMIVARTHHIDTIIKQNERQYQQIVFVGVGLDFRMYRMNKDFEGKKCFLLDLSEMLAERNKVKTQFHHLPQISEVDIPCNFITENISLKLVAAGFDKSISSLFIFEGCSMYFSETENSIILDQLSELLKGNRNSRLWIDVADEKIFDKENVKDFLKSIAKLGEPFIYGFNKSNNLFKKYNLLTVEEAHVKDIIPDTDGDVYDLYSFCLLRYG